ncbi:hypothetical protein D3C87_1722650 [compost metagenome]
MKKKLILGVLTAIILVVGGCFILFKLKDKEIVHHATEVATHYFKEHYDIELVITGYKVNPIYVNDEVGLSGHIKGNEEAFINLSLDYKDNYKFTGVNAPKWIIEKYNISVSK